MPLVDARAKFMVPAKFGDVVEMHSYVGEFRRSSFDVEHRFSVDGKLAVEGSETRVWAAPDKDNRPAEDRRPIPAEVIAKFRTAPESFKQFPVFEHCPPACWKVRTNWSNAGPG